MNPKRTRRRFKAEVALATLTERQPLAELALAISFLSARSRAGSSSCARKRRRSLPSPPQPLYAAIGKLQMENQLLKKIQRP